MLQKMGPGRVCLDYGPIQMTITAFNDGKPLDKEAIEAGKYAKGLLKILSDHLPKAKRLITKINYDKKVSREEVPQVLRLMLEAVKATGDITLTPMAVVAGTFADEVADFLVEKGATKVIVNNGGDIAFRLKKKESIVVGITSGINDSTYNHVLRVKASDGYGGIATSGLGGRSLTKGIASSVTVIGTNCRVADACATLIANNTFYDDPGIIRLPAEKVDPDTDIKGQLVTVGLKPLESKIFYKAMVNGINKANCLLKNNIISGVMIFAGPYMSVLPETFAAKIEEKS